MDRLIDPEVAASCPPGIDHDVWGRAVKHEIAHGRWAATRGLDLLQWLEGVRLAGEDPNCALARVTSTPLDVISAPYRSPGAVVSQRQVAQRIQAGDRGRISGAVSSADVAALLMRGGATDIEQVKGAGTDHARRRMHPSTDANSRPTVGDLPRGAQEAFFVGFWAQMSILYSYWSQRNGGYPEMPASGLWHSALRDLTLDQVQETLLVLARERTPRDLGPGYVPSPADFREVAKRQGPQISSSSTVRAPTDDVLGPTEAGLAAAEALRKALRL